VLRISLLLVISAFFLSPEAMAQEAADTSGMLNEVSLRAYFRDQPLLSSPSSAAVITGTTVSRFGGTSLVPAVNTIAGVRMEERSPGSYRLSIRGSLLRSPFGIRNVKVYSGNFLLTDAGGNTYFNLFDAALLSRIEVLKGPEGSVFGANTGGVVLAGDAERQDLSPAISGGVSAGSYSLFHENASISLSGKTYGYTFSQAFQRSDGYRDNSALQRQFYRLGQRLNYGRSSSLQSLLLYSDLRYRTPGGLTFAQLQADPAAARPPAGAIPGAESQHAGVTNRTFFGGVANETGQPGALKFVTALSYMHTDFSNPFITNYEQRNENSLGLRTFIERSFAGTAFSGKSVAGIEAQTTGSSIANYGNRSGVRDTVQAADDLAAGQAFGFLYFQLVSQKGLVLEAASSIDFYGYTYSSRYPLILAKRKRRFDPQVMPRLATAFPVLPGFVLRASAGRGYSPPTVAEVRASDNVVNTGLQAERGWNFEAGLRYKSKRWYVDASAFDFRLRQAIVRRVNVNDAEYFINAGGTDQKGIESAIKAWLLEPSGYRLVHALQVNGSYTFSKFRFDDYLNGANDLSGNHLTGVPAKTFVTGLRAMLGKGFELFAQHDYASAVPLNDDNTVFAKPYHLFRCQADMTIPAGTGGYYVRFTIGADNVFNASYSLGNDLNAAGGRYYNPAPPRNYYAGIRISRQ
jgi:iron complex outermembrane receptor protein